VRPGALHFQNHIIIPPEPTSKYLHQVSNNKYVLSLLAIFIFQGGIIIKELSDQKENEP
jgi:hypothetical protein